MAASGCVDGTDGRDGKMQAVLATLERGIAAILDGDAFARYLATLPVTLHLNDVRCDL